MPKFLAGDGRDIAQVEVGFSLALEVVSEGQIDHHLLEGRAGIVRLPVEFGGRPANLVEHEHSGVVDDGKVAYPPAGEGREIPEFLVRGAVVQAREGHLDAVVLLVAGVGGGDALCGAGYTVHALDLLDRGRGCGFGVGGVLGGLEAP